MTKEELKDEIKTRISMALKDPILQQGFESICKENTKLKGEADSLLNNWCKEDNPCPHLKKRDEQLTKAKELIEELSSSLSVVGECEEEECELLNRAEQFISEVDK